MCALKFGLSPDERSLLESHLCPNLTEGSEQGWEETVEASLTYLLKTSLAKAFKVIFYSFDDFHIRKFKICRLFRIR